jgi:lysophospholipase L1-like esterase
MRRRTTPTQVLAGIAIAILSWSYAAEAAVIPRLERGAHLNIVALGTSLTDANFNAQNWFAQVGAWLSAKYPGQVTLSNRAVSGTTSANMPQIDRPHGGPWQLDQALAHDNPDVIFIEFAINDASKHADMSVADSRKNLKTLIGRINAWAGKKGKTVDIIVQTMNNTGPAVAASWNDVAPYYKAWAEEAASQHLLLIDHYRNWIDRYNSEPSHATWNRYVPDGLHPNTLGTTKMIVPAVQRALIAQAKPPNPKLVRLPFAFTCAFHEALMENTPVIFKGRPLLVQNYRSAKPDEQETKSYLFIQDLTTGQEAARLGTGFSFVSAFVNGDEMNVFGTMSTNKEWTKDVFRFWSADLKTWKQEKVISRDGDEHLFNTSVCRDDQGYVMAYESNKPVQWCFRFARSKDLSKWEKVQGLEFADMESQTACGNPTIRYFAPYYYMVYGIWRFKGPGTHYEYLLPETKYVTAVARSKDLATWELSPTRGPMLDPTPGEGINNTDADLFEFQGNTYIYYATGEQTVDWGTIRMAMYAGPMKEMLEAYFPAGASMIKFDAKQRKYIYPQ